MYLHRIPEILWSHEGSKVTCLLCPHYCVIPEGKTGKCRTRINKEGVLYSLAYGNPCSVAIDPIEKKPLYHFLPGSQVLSIATAGCNFRCLNCQNWTISQASPENIDHYDLSPGQIINMALRHKTPSIAFTYTEPTVFYEYMFDIAVKAHEKGLKTIMVSNGYINSGPLEALCPYIDAANIDLKCFDDKMYRRLTGGKLQPVLDTLLTLQKAGVWTEITHLVIPGMTDNPVWFESMCRWLVDNGFASAPLHISRFFPAYKLAHLPPTPVEKVMKEKEIAEKCGLKFVYPGNI
ncbi:MAG: AmmeMemoRadiSam system radical SAM enzyme [Bacteroidales bacterium]|nr:AmmeMemoRadiSam system radical SAM enzyme [Bacteroidales bacterium]